MKMALSVWITVLVIVGSLAPAAMAAPLVTFDGGIGVNPVSNAGTAAAGATPNSVLGVSPGGQPWVISGLKARVTDNGNITVQGRGLLLAGGNTIGTNGGQSVFATLFCGTAAHSTNPVGVALEPDGDFKIDDTLSPAPPNPCTNPVLLIRSTANQRWFAAGIPGE